MQRFDLKRANGLNLSVARGGKGRALVLIHGALSMLDEMLIGPFDRLARQFDVVAVDRPGHGGSERRRFDASIWSQARAIREGVQQLGLERPVIAGHSFGGAVAMAYALDFPDEISGALAISPLAMPEPMRPDQFLYGPRAVPLLGDVFAFTAGPVIDAAMGPLILRAMFHPQPVPERFKAEFPFEKVMAPRQAQANGEDSIEAMSGLALAAFRYSGCGVPVTVLSGDRDHIANPFLHARRLAQLVPRGKLVDCPGMGHMPHHFQPDLVAEAAAELAA